MAEDQHTMCSNSSSGGDGGGSGSGGGGGGGGSHRSSSKKLKHKKPPQRGMGVAQLEKIISEQQQKNQNQNQNHQPDRPRLTAGFAANLGGFAHQLNPSTWTPPPNLMLQRSQHFHQPCSSSMMNVSTGTSSSLLSSVLNSQMEPPSNQSYYGNNNNYHPLWQEEQKMVGVKRAYPFSLENSPNPSFHYRLPSAYVSPISRSEESGTASVEHVHPSIRENLSSSSAKSDATTMKFIDENQYLTKDFLKLAPPQASQSDSNTKEKLHLSPKRVQSEDPSNLSGRNHSNQEPFLGFFPAAKTPMGQPENSDVEAGENVDLNLKL